MEGKVWIEGKYYDLPPGVSLLPFEGKEAHEAKLRSIVEYHDKKPEAKVEPKKDAKKKK